MPQVLLSVLRISLGNRLDDQPVVLHDVLCLARTRKMEAAQAVDMPAAVAHEQPQIVHAGSFIKMLMERLVGSGKSFEIFHLHERLLLREKSLKLGDEAWIRIERQASDDLEFQRAP